MKYLLAFSLVVTVCSCSSSTPMEVTPDQGPGVVVRRHPLPQHFYPLKKAVCNEAELRQLSLLTDPRFPDFKYHQLPLALIYHAMRVWGKACPCSEETEDQFSSRDEGLYLRIITSNAEYKKRSRISVSQFLSLSDVGVHVVTSGDAVWGSQHTSTHFGKYILLMAELGITADYPLMVTTEHPNVLEDVIVNHAWNVHLADEQDWVAPGLARYLVSRQWRNRFGQSISFDDLVYSLVKRPLGQGACYGTHMPYALAAILDVNQQKPILSSAAETAAKRKLSECGQLLVRTQSSDGSWGKDWHSTDPKDKPTGEMLGFVQMDRVITTGHTLEWLITCPAELRPDDLVLAHAAVFLKRTLPALRQALKDDNLHWYLFVSHAVRGLLLAHGHRWANQTCLKPHS